MYREFSSVQLKSAETMEIGLVRAPDAEHADELESFLEHKGEPWLFHVRESLQDRAGKLETRFYVGKLGGKIISNVMTVEWMGVGILGHVFTAPEHRRKGACKAVMQVLMEDFRSRGGRLLYLGTGYDSPAYWIYHSFGFRSVVEGSGSMRYAVDEDFEPGLFAPSPTRTVQAEWHHWPLVNALTMQKEGDLLRLFAFGGLSGFTSVEGSFLRLKSEMQKDDRCRMEVLEAENGAACGVALTRPDPAWRGGVCTFDLFVHPNFHGDAARLAGSFHFPEGKMLAYADELSRAKIEALEQAGFEREGTLKNQLMKDGKPLDVFVYGKIVGA